MRIQGHSWWCVVNRDTLVLRPPDNELVRRGTSRLGQGAMRELGGSPVTEEQRRPGREGAACGIGIGWSEHLLTPPGP